MPYFEKDFSGNSLRYLYFSSFYPHFLFCLCDAWDVHDACDEFGHEHRAKAYFLHDDWGTFGGCYRCFFFGYWCGNHHDKPSRYFYDFQVWWRCVSRLSWYPNVAQSWQNGTFQNRVFGGYLQYFFGATRFYHRHRQS